MSSETAGATAETRVETRKRAEWIRDNTSEDAPPPRMLLAVADVLALLDALDAAVVDASPFAEVVVDGDAFERRELPQVLANVRRSLADARREAKAMHLLREDATAALERVTDEHLQERLIEEVDINESEAAAIVHLIESLAGGVCQGDEHCKAPRHEHGCYADLDGSACNDPDEHHGTDGDGPDFMDHTDRMDLAIQNGHEL